MLSAATGYDCRIQHQAASTDPLRVTAFRIVNFAVLGMLTACRKSSLFSKCLLGRTVSRISSVAPSKCAALIVENKKCSAPFAALGFTLAQSLLFRFPFRSRAFADAERTVASRNATPASRPSRTWIWWRFGIPHGSTVDPSGVATPYRIVPGRTSNLGKGRETRAYAQEKCRETEGRNAHAGLP